MRFLLFFFLLFSFNAYATKNLHLIDKDNSSGYAIYRTSKPKKPKDVLKLCQLGIEEIAVLSGNAIDYEYKYHRQCPNLKVVYNQKQNARIPLRSGFLSWFDSWVQEAREEGKKIAFRCNCGCHRTGRLAAYYQMKYQSLTSTDAKIIMKKHGKFMFLFKTLFHQVEALEDHIYQRDCSTKLKYCVQN